MPVTLQLLAATATALQWAVAWRILARRPVGPFRVVTAALLALNGLASLRLALAAAVPEESDRWFSLADGPTGVLLVASGILLFRFPRHETWDRRAQWVLGGASLWAAVILGPGLTLRGFGDFVEPNYSVLHTLPAFLGLGLNGLAAALAVGRADRAKAAEAGFLGFAFLASLTTNTAHSGTIYIGDNLALLPDPAAWPRLAGMAAALALAVAAAMVLVLPGRSNAGWRRVLLFGWAGGVLLALANHPSTSLGSPDARYAFYLLETSTLYLVRPFCVGLALVPRDTLWALYDSAAAVVLLVVGKTVSWALFDVPLDRFLPSDLAGAGIALLLAPVAWVVPRHLLRRRKRTVEDMPADLQLARYLLSRFRESDGRTFATKREIESATGITENNLAGVVRRLEQRLGGDAPLGSLVVERRVGVRGRKQYALAPEGAQRAEAALRTG